MKTEVVKIPADHPDPEAVERAATVLRDGGLVALPTETVYGIAARADRPAAVERLLQVRDCGRDRNLTLHLGDVDQLVQHVSDIPVFASRLIHRFWPGPLTLVFEDPRGPGSPAVGIRIPAHPVCSEILVRVGAPVVIPSANRSGQPPAQDAEEVRRTFDGRIDMVVDAGPSRLGTASTVVRVSRSRWDLLRAGAIPASLLQDLDYRKYLFVCTGNTCRSPMAAALFRLHLARRLGVAEEALPERGIQVASAGTDAGYGGGCASNAAVVVAELGGTLADHRTQPVTAALLEESDHVFVMTRSHLTTLQTWAPEAGDRIRQLDPSGRDIDDPIGGNKDDYRRVAEKLVAFLGGPLDGAVREAQAFTQRR